MANLPPDGIRPGSANNIPNARQSKKPEIKPEIQEQSQILSNTDLSKNPASVAGRSQVKKTKFIDTAKFDPELVQNIAADMEKMANNPKIAFGSNKVFNNVYKNTND